MYYNKRATIYICYDLHQYQILVQSNNREVHIFLHTSIVELINLPYNSTSRESYYHYIKVISLYKHSSAECKTAIYSSIYDNLVELFVVCLM